MHLQGHIVITVAGDIFQLQNDILLVDTVLPRRIFLCHFAADHQADQFIHRSLGRNQGCHVLAVADNFDPVAQTEDLFQTVGNVNDGNPLGTKQFHDLKHVFYFVGGKRCARFVHNQNLRVLLDRLRDLDHLLISDRKIFHQLPGIDLDLKLGEGLCGFRFHGFSVDHDSVADRPSEEQIFRSGKLSDIVEFLVNDGDTVLGCQLRGHTVKLFSVDLDLSRGRNNGSRTAFDQGGFPGPVFTDQSEDLALAKLKGDVFQGNYAGVFFSDMFQLKDIFFTHTLPAS